jgi:hypothetical protein
VVSCAGSRPTPTECQEVVTEQFQKLTSKGGGSCPTNHSFVAATLVLMADGTTKPIAEVEIGDKVKAPTRPPAKPPTATWSPPSSTTTKTT